MKLRGSMVANDHAVNTNAPLFEALDKMEEIALRVDKDNDHGGGAGSDVDKQLFDNLKCEITKLKSNQDRKVEKIKLLQNPVMSKTESVVKLKDKNQSVTQKLEID